MCVYPHVEAHVWKSEDSLRGLIDHFPHVAPGDCTLLVSLGSRYLPLRAEPFSAPYILFILCVYDMWVCIPQQCVWRLEGNFLELVNLLFLSCELSILNPGHQTWQQLTLPAELFCLIMAGFLK